MDYLPWPFTRRCLLLLMNSAGAIYTLTIVVTQLGVNAFYTCPMVYGTNACYLPILFGLYVAFNTLLAWLLFRTHARFNRVGDSITEIGTSFHSNGTLKHCYTCNIDVPSRCHHCPLCEFCVLKKDHHCFLTGACVGFANQRYFMIFLFWAFVGCLYGTVYSARYLNHFYVPALPFGWVEYFFPLAFMKFIFGFMPRGSDFGNLLICLLTTSGWVSAWGCFAFFVSQWYFILSGITMWEMMHKLKVDDFLTPGQRVRAVFGPTIFLQFLCPLPFRHRKDLPWVMAVTEDMFHYHSILAFIPLNEWRRVAPENRLSPLRNSP